jgi:glutaconyl-CoA/methylmalonyl-CoA decarboxylase subunit gamma
MNVLLTRGAQDLDLSLEPEGSGFRITLEGRAHRLEGLVGGATRVLIDDRPVEATVRIQGEEIRVVVNGGTFGFRLRDPRAPRLKRRAALEDGTRGELHAPMPGLVVEILAREGEEVEAGRPVVVVEAMKMQNALLAPTSGRVRSVPVSPGTPVETGQLLIAITPDGA